MPVSSSSSSSSSFPVVVLVDRVVVIPSAACRAVGATSDFLVIELYKPIKNSQPHSRLQKMRLINTKTTIMDCCCWWVWLLAASSFSSSSSSSRSCEKIQPSLTILNKKEPRAPYPTSLVVRLERNAFVWYIIPSVRMTVIHTISRTLVVKVYCRSPKGGCIPPLLLLALLRLEAIARV